MTNFSGTIRTWNSKRNLIEPAPVYVTNPMTNGANSPKRVRLHTILNKKYRVILKICNSN